MPSGPNLTTNVLLRSEETGGHVSVTEIVVPPHSAGPPLYTHDFDEVFYVLEGEPNFRAPTPCAPRSPAFGSEFKYDFGAAFTEEQQRHGAGYNFQYVDDPGQQETGMSAFVLRDGVVHHTYSTYGRGVEALMGTYRYLDLAPLGRNEEDLHTSGPWWRRHDEYPSA